MSKRVMPMLAVVAVLFVATTVGAQSLPTGKPADVGLSPERLERIKQIVNADVEKGRLPGAVLLIARKGRIAYFESMGFRDSTTGAPMTRDAIFRIYSMTKPITSVAVMMLVEEGRLQLAEPIAKYLPQLGKREVGLESLDPATGKPTFHTVPAAREITIHDLLRHTSGLTYGVFGKSTVKEMYTKAGADARDHTNAELVDKLGKLPLAYQPGTTWEYSRSTDVLGRLVEVVSGKTLGEFFEERIFRPLKMTDSGFSVPEAKRARIAQPLPKDPDTGQPVQLLDVTAPPRYESGGGGGVSTAMDYARFGQMLLNRGALDGVRLLAKKTVEYMTTDHVGAIADRSPTYTPGPGYGFGLGFAVRKEPGLAPVPGSVGEFYWAGLGGTYFWVDPKEELVTVWMAQGPGQRAYYRALIKDLVLSALIE